MQSTLGQQGVMGMGKDVVGGVIKSGEKIQLLNNLTKRFVSIPEMSTENWDTGIAGTNPAPHVLLPINKPTGTIAYGDQIRIQTLNPHNQRFEFMYSSPLGYIWYDQFADNSKQFWIIQKEGTGLSGTGEVKSGDLVYFENVGYPGSRLYEKDGQLCCGVSNHVWEIKSAE